METQTGLCLGGLITKSMPSHIETRGCRSVQNMGYALAIPSGITPRDHSKNASVHQSKKPAKLQEFTKPETSPASESPLGLRSG